MELLGGKSYENGIDFSVKDGNKRYVLRTRKNENGEIETSICNCYSNVAKNSKNRNILSAIFAVIFVGMYISLKGQTSSFITIAGWLIVLALFWLGLIGYCYFESKDEKNVASARYHSAEHKVLNYYFKHSKLPESVHEIKNKSNVYICCGSSVVAVVLLFLTLVFISLLIFPNIILKSVGIIVSVFASFILWAHGKCNFIQKFFIKPPTEDELELAIYAMKKLLEDENMV